jgi:radical SAM protein with 4Fe4S-binding SPASM domain
MIETNRHCNGKCTMCRHGYEELSGVMPAALFDRLLDECVTLHVPTVDLCGCGEPLLDPHFLDRVRSIRARNLKYTITTNGSVMKEETSRELHELGGLELIQFSVNGYSREVYEKVMPGLDYDVTMKNVLGFLAFKQHVRWNVTVNLSCVVTGQNCHEISPYVAYWKKQPGVDRLNIADMWIRKLEHVARAGQCRPLLYRNDTWQSPCSHLWRNNVVVYANGKVSPCCIDIGEQELIIGDLYSSTLQELFSGNALRALQTLHLNDCRARHPVCNVCTQRSIWWTR